MFVKKLCKADGQIWILHVYGLLSLNGRCHRVAGEGCMQSAVKDDRERDEKGDDEYGQEDPAEVIGLQVVPLWTVHACVVPEVAQTVVREEVKSFGR